MHRGKAGLAGTDHHDVIVVGLGKVGDRLRLYEEARDKGVGLGFFGGHGAGQRHGAGGEAGGSGDAGGLEQVAAGNGGFHGCVLSGKELG